MAKKVKVRAKRRSGLKIKKIPTDEELYKLLSVAARSLYGPKCEICGKLGTQAMHFHGKKAHPSVRFDLRNILWACTKCHIFDSHMRSDMEHARRALMQRLGADGFEQLYIDAHTGGKITALDRDRIKDQMSMLALHSGHS